MAYAASDSTCNPSLVTVNTLNRIAELSYDAARNVTQDGSTTYQYDAEHRLKSINGGAVATYVYNAGGQRVRRIVGGTTTEYIYDLGGNVVAEKVGTTWTVGYVYLGGALVAQYKDSTTYFVHKDHLGPVCGLRWSPLRCFQSGKINRSPKAGPDSRNRSSTRLLTKLDKSPLETAYDYLPFGEPIGSSGSGTTKKFTGKERDAESGLDYFGARYYVSTTGRFLNPDLPFIDQHLTNPQSWNLYHYARNNPLNFTDPTGNWSEEAANRLPMSEGEGVNSFGNSTCQSCWEYVERRETAALFAYFDATQKMFRVLNAGQSSQVQQEQSSSSVPPRVQSLIDEGQPPDAEHSFLRGMSCPDCKYYPKEVVEVVKEHENQHRKDTRSLSGFFKIFTRNGCIEL